jgi:hypothetical protein
MGARSAVTRRSLLVANAEGVYSMNKIAMAVIAGLLVSTGASGQVRVKGYVTKNGTYVAPYYRSSPNSTKLDNYSTKGNINPYTGKAGTVDPYSNPYSSYSYGSHSSSSSSYGSYGSYGSQSTDSDSDSDPE